MSWRFIAESVVLAIHDAQLAEHGGGTGIRDEGLLRSTLARPENLVAYGENPDVADLAAAYAFGIVRGHPFVDGNKRTGFVVMELFLDLNGRTLEVDDLDAIQQMEALAAGTVSEADFAVWIRDHLTGGI